MQVQPLFSRGNIIQGQVYRVWHGLVNILPSMDVLNKLFRDLKPSLDNPSKDRDRRFMRKSGTGIKKAQEDDWSDIDSILNSGSDRINYKEIIQKAKQVEQINKERAEFNRVEQEFKKKASEQIQRIKQNDASFDHVGFRQDDSFSSPSKISVLKDLSDNVS